MGQLQKRFQDQSLAQFQTSPEGSVSWLSQPGDTPKAEIPVSPSSSPQSNWQLRALYLGAGVIVILAAVLFLG